MAKLNSEEARMVFCYATMGAGKTLDMLRLYDTYLRKEFNPLIIKSAIDNREGNFHGMGYTQSRFGGEQSPKYPAFYYKDFDKEVLNGILKEQDCKILFVDEAQFMSEKDVLKLFNLVHEKNLPVRAYGLKVDAYARLFNGSAALLAMSNDHWEIKTACQNNGCQHDAKFHLRYVDGKLDKSGDSVAIESGNVKYLSVCPECWYKAMNSKGK